MAEVLSSPPRSGEPALLAAGWWQVDVLIVGYLAASALLIAVYFGRIPDGAWLLAAHIAAIGSIAAVIRARPDPQSPLYRLRAIFRYWYPLPYVGACYKTMAIFIPAIRGTDLDARIARLDYRLWSANPTVWLERLYNPWLTEVLQLAYTLFVPCAMVIAALFWLMRRYSDFRYYAFLVSLGFLASYIGYFVVPVRGPRFFLAHLQHTNLHGLWLFENMQRFLDRLESAHYDCFPSGHTELTMIAWWSSRRISMKLFAAYCVYTILIVFATIYLRYHYTIDVFAGAILAAILLAAAPGLYAAAGGRRQGGGSSPAAGTFESRPPMTQEDN
jgi:membrane-associated phospholipid phosphatase